MAISARRLAVVALVTVPAGLVSAAEMISGRPIPMLRHWNDKLEPFPVVNRYHVFPTMDNARIAAQIEVSREGGDWAPLDFRCAPDQPDQAPAFVVPPQPRVDWLPWFVPRGPVFLDWLERFLNQLLTGSPAVTALLQPPPFTDGPPQRARLRAWRDRFTTGEERAESDEWWRRQALGPFYPFYC